MCNDKKENSRDEACKEREKNVYFILIGDHFSSRIFLCVIGGDM